MSDKQIAGQSELSRRGFVQALGAGVLIAVSADGLLAQERPRRGGRGGGNGFMGSGASNLSARIHIGQDGSITVMTGKVEAGQGARAELTQAAAEELRVSVERVTLIMSDTGLVPNDGMTAGSGTTPRTVPAVRKGCAAARTLLVQLACRKWGVEASHVQVQDGKATHGAGHELSYAELASDPESIKGLKQPVPEDVNLMEVKEWKVLGAPVARPNGRDLVSGDHKYPSDVIRPGMLYAKVLRPPSYGAKLVSIDLGPAKAMADVVVVREDQFVGTVAPSSFRARQALAAIEKTAKWETVEHPGSNELYEYLRQHAGVAANPFAEEFSKSPRQLRQTYNIAYIQHAPLEPRAAVAEWMDGKLTVWTGTQNPFGVKSELQRALNVPADDVRVIVPDFGGGFGGKHSGEAALEAARLSRAAGKPVSLRWTREEEFTWAYFRPAGVIDVEAGLDDSGRITSWHFVNVNSGGSSIETPYKIAKARGRFVQSQSPLRQSSYRGLAATANTFARECAMDELAAMAGADPLEFRLKHLEEPRLRAVLETATKRFDWLSRAKQKRANVGVGLACGTEKGSFVAACAEVVVDRKRGACSVRRVAQVFDCGAVMNPLNLTGQIQGAIIMGLGAALREAIRFDGGKITNASFKTYLVPRMEDLPELDIHLLDRLDEHSAGAGETPIIAIAPAIANAVFDAIGVRVRQMPIRIPQSDSTSALRPSPG